MNKTIKNIFVCLSFVLFSWGVALGGQDWGYPLRQVSKPSCRWESWNSLSSDCVMDLPIIKDMNYEKYKNNLTYRILYTVLRASNYSHGWDVGYGGHMGVDIATSKGTPVYAIGDGKVVTAGWLQGWGHTIVVEHKINGNTIYAGYGHLSSVNVNPGQRVDKNDIIGGVGSTGNSTGNHLHFQLDIEDNSVAQSPPYYFSSCNVAGEIRTIGSDECLEYVTKYSLDPIEFLETNGANIEGKSSDQIIKETEERKQEKRESIDPASMMDRETVRLTELEMFLARYNFSISGTSRVSPIYIGDQKSIDLNINYSHNNRPFDGLFPENIEFQYDDNIIDVFPSSMKSVSNGNREIKVTARKQGHTKLRIKIGDKIISNIDVRVISKNTVVEPKKAILKKLGRKLYIGSNNIALAYFQDSNSSNIINIPFEGVYRVLSDEYSKLCPIPYNKLKDIQKIENYECGPDELVNSFKFDLSDTIEGTGLLIFKLYGQNYGRTEIEIYNGNSQLGNWRYNVRYPIDIKRANSNYQKSIKNMINKSIITNYNNRYFHSSYSIRETTAIDWIENVFSQYYINKVKDGDRFNRLSRLEFVKLLSKITGKTSSDTNRHFWDVDSEDRKYVNLMVDLNIEFMDKYNSRYFQPDKQITRGEVAYILDKFYNMVNKN